LVAGERGRKGRSPISTDFKSSLKYFGIAPHAAVVGVREVPYIKAGAARETITVACYVVILLKGSTQEIEVLVWPEPDF
jgi:hypothetical protein